jgi:hypothetical protein
VDGAFHLEWASKSAILGAPTDATDRCRLDQANSAKTAWDRPSTQLRPTRVRVHIATGTGVRCNAATTLPGLRPGEIDDEARANTAIRLHAPSTLRGHGERGRAGVITPDDAVIAQRASRPGSRR